MEEGESAKSVSRRCALGPVEVAQLELGRADLNSDELAEVVAAYAVPRVIFPEFHSVVKVDLAAGSVSITVSDTPVGETAADRTLLVYFELIFGPSKMSPTTAIPFTALDLDVLRVVLASRRNEVTRHLELLVGPPEEPSVLPRRIAQGVVVVLAAAAIAAGVIALVDAQSSTATKVPPVVSSAPSPPAAIAPAGAPIKTEILDALVIVREPSLVTTTPIDLAKGPQ
jgi:hypothetical protein